MSIHSSANAFSITLIHLLLLGRKKLKICLHIQSKRFAFLSKAKYYCHFEVVFIG